MTGIVVRQLNVPVNNLPKAASGFRIAHLSDLHLRRWGKSEDELQQTLLNLDCDMLLITGDFGHIPAAYERTAELVRRLLTPVKPPLGIYGVLGNHDELRLADQDLPLTMLRDEVRLIHVGGFEFYLVGVEQTDAKRGTIAGAVDELPTDAPVVIMAHYPSTVFELASGAGAIMLSGHTHGGQIRIPGLGCLWTNDRVPRAMARGLHATQGNWLHVSPGTGTSGPLPVRVFCPREIGMIRLRRAQRVASRTTVNIPQLAEAAA